MLTKAQQAQRAWYAKNAKRIQAKRRERYASDPAYRESRREARAKRYDSHRKHQSGLLTQGEYRALVEKQQGLCKICRTFVGLQQGPGTGNYGLVVDHNHATNKIRGLLCSQCNTAIGQLKDSPEICRMAAKYLEEGLS